MRIVLLKRWGGYGAGLVLNVLGEREDAGSALAVDAKRAQALLASGLAREEGIEPDEGPEYQDTAWPTAAADDEAVLAVATKSDRTTRRGARRG